MGRAAFLTVKETTKTLKILVYQGIQDSITEHRMLQCPPNKEKAIKEALKHFGMIK